MRKPIVLTLNLILISACLGLTACGTVAGDVIPKTGPKMEQVYDSMHRSDHSHHDGGDENYSGRPNAQKMNAIRHHFQSHSMYRQTSYSSERGFQKIPNPELRMYIYPHFSGSDQVPVPGYQTVFNAYEKNYYRVAGQG